MSDAMLMRVVFSAEFPQPIQERLTFMQDGSVWLHLMHAVDNDNQQWAGTFRNTLSAAESAELAQQLEQVAAQTFVEEPLRRNAILVSLNELTGEKRQFGFTTSSSRPAEQTFLAQITLIRQRLLTTPYAAVQLTVRAQTPNKIAFVCSHVGSESLQILLRRDRFAVWQEEDGWGVISAENSLGLLGKYGALIDGLTTPALLQPGLVGTLLLDLPVHETLDCANPLAPLGKLSGSIELLGPTDELDNLYETTFSIVAQGET